jgi:hypothetical protein
MTYREIKEKLESRGFALTASQTDYELPMLHFTNPKLLNCEVTIQFSHDTVIPEDVKDGREYSFDEDWILDAEISTFETDFDISMSFMSEGTLDVCGAIDDNIIFIHGKDIYLVDKVLDLMLDPYVAINFAVEYSQKVSEFMAWIKTFIPTFSKLKLKPITFRINGDEDVLYSSIGVNFVDNSLHGIQFYFDVLTWKKHGHIKIGFDTDDDKAWFDETTSLQDFRTELGIRWQQHLWYMEAMKNVRSVGTKEVTYKDGKKGKIEDLVKKYL